MNVLFTLLSTDVNVLFTLPTIDVHVLFTFSIVELIVMLNLFISKYEPSDVLLTYTSPLTVILLDKSNVFPVISFNRCCY